MDGDDAQQPVIFGTLYKQPFVPDQLTTAQFNAKKQTCFVPYTPPKVRQTAGKTHITKIHQCQLQCLMENQLRLLHRNKSQLMRI